MQAIVDDNDEDKNVREAKREQQQNPLPSKNKLAIKQYMITMSIFKMY
jgi:hypothetical protein